MNTLLKVILGLIGSVVAFFLIVIFVLNPFVKWDTANKPPVGSSPDDHFIRIQGLKPDDANMVAYATFYGGGDECGSFFWSASDGKKRQGGRGVFEIKHDFSTTPSQYELRIPYQNYQSSGCDMKLHQITIEVNNQFDQGGFANLRISQSGKTYNKAISLDSKIEAKNCNGNIYPWAKDMWKGSINCDYSINGKLINKAQLTYNNGYTAYFNFSQFNDDTVIHYDILAGENYRSQPLDPQTGE